MQQYICSIHDRQYLSWDFKPNNPDVENISPIIHHLFDQDQFQYCSETETIEIIHSPIRNAIYLTGVLILENGKTYGRTDNKKRLYYSCIPHNKKIPIFLVPYDLELGFSKSIPNKYVTFSFKEWVQKHPIGILKETIGDVTHLPSYYEYQLYCKNLHISIKNSMKMVYIKQKEKTEQEWVQSILSNPNRFGEIQDRREIDRTIMSIDPDGCMDRDDAFSIETIQNSNPNLNQNPESFAKYKVSIYIANIWVWLEAFQLWNHIGERKSTIYLPDMNRPMLPPKLGEGLCSLDVKQSRFAFVMDFIITEHPIHGIQISSILSPILSQVCIRVSKNYDYESSLLLQNKNYQLLLSITEQIDCKKHDSHSLVSFWMIKMNSYLAENMREKQMGIFRTINASNMNPKSNIERTISPETKQFIQIFEQQMSGNYTKYDSTIHDYSHSVMDVSAYIHFTSPIRRICDLLNQMIWIRFVINPSEISNEFIVFLEKQWNDIDSLNKQMKDIRKIQSDSCMLYECSRNPNLLKESLECIILSCNENERKNEYSIYIEKYKWIFQIKTYQLYEKYQHIMCKLFLFEKEDQTRQKIRLQIL